jgi:hypothetical protein
VGGPIVFSALPSLLLPPVSPVMGGRIPVIVFQNVFIEMKYTYCSINRLKMSTLGTFGHSQSWATVPTIYI